MDQSVPRNLRRIAILVDAENISADNWPAIARLFDGLGDATTLTCFANFTNPAHAGWLDVCRRRGGTAVMVLKTGGKNGADIALTIAAMELLIAGAAEMFVIASSDSDFAPLAHRITATGRIAVGIGRDTANEDLRRAYTRYVVLPAAVPAAKPAPQAATVPNPQLVQLAALVDRLSRMDPTGAVLLSHLGLVLKRENPALAASLGKGKLRKVLRENGLVEEHGEGTAIRVSPRRMKPGRQTA
jgi:hypothetical protein